jgi:hypothetical protein
MRLALAESPRFGDAVGANGITPGMGMDRVDAVRDHLSVDAVAVILIVRGDRDQLDVPTRRMLLSVTQRQRIVLPGLTVNDVGPLAAALGA